jgi:hypothetical protein
LLSSIRNDIKIAEELDFLSDKNIIENLNDKKVKTREFLSLSINDKYMKQFKCKNVNLSASNSELWCNLDD